MTDNENYFVSGTLYYNKGDYCVATQLPFEIVSDSEEGLIKEFAEMVKKNYSGLKRQFEHAEKKFEWDLNHEV